MQVLQDRSISLHTISKFNAVSAVFIGSLKFRLHLPLKSLKGHICYSNRSSTQFTARIEALPNLYGKTATIIIADRTLQVLLL